MKHQYAYVMSNPAGAGLPWLALASAAAVRQCDPQARLTLLADDESLSVLPSRLSKSLEATFDDIRAIQTPYPAGPLASRHLKTSVRQVLEGDFLFLDIDTLMFEVPGDVFRGSHDIGACKDRNIEHWRPHHPDWVRPHYERLGWSFSSRGYLNTGVLFLRESTAARRFGLEWHARWKSFVEVSGQYQDQPAFNSLIGGTDLSVLMLPLRYNAMVDAVPFFCWRASIVHYFLHGGRRLAPADSLLWALANRWESTGEFDQALYSEGRRRRDPWIHPTSSIQVELATGRPLRALALLRQRVMKGR